MAQWIRALAQTTTYLGAMIIIVIWSGVAFLANGEHQRAYEQGLLQGRNLSRVFEEYIARLINGTDSQLLILRELYRQNPDKFDLASWINGARGRDDLTLQVSIIGADGVFKATSFGPVAPIDISGREDFLVQRNSSTDDLFISAPVALRTSGKRAIVLTRRLMSPEGAFGGVIHASLDIEAIERFYNSVDIGSTGVISLVGFDGIIRARSGRGLAENGLTGQSIVQAKVFDLYRNASMGSYWNFETPAGAVDGVRRLISYRVVEGLPLLAIVGLAESDVFRQTGARVRLYYEISIGLTVFVLAAMGFGAARQHKLNAAAAALETSRQSLEQISRRFNLALENMPHGLCMFDRDQRLIICNRRYGEIYGLAPAQTKPGTTLREILESRVAAGNAPEDAERYIAARLEEVARPEPYYAVNELRDGRIFAISHQPMGDGGWVAIHEDLTGLRSAEAQVDEANQKLIEKQYAIDQAVIVAVTDVKGRITYANDNFCRISGYSREELLGANHRILKSGVHTDTFFGDMYRQTANGQVWRGEICNKAKDGSLYWVDTTIVPQLGPNGKPISYMAIRIDVTARKEAEAQIAYMARHDALTGLANRAVLLEKMEEASARVRRRQGAFSIFLLDLDGFKNINDTLGHAAGDELLRQLAQRLRSSLRETEVLARLGGDEFAIIQGGEVDQREAAIALAVRLLEIVARPFNLDGHNVAVGTSIGISLAPEDGCEPGELLQKADLALYEVKSEGRNNFKLFHAEMSKDTAARLRLISDMREALSRDEFELHYQPIFDVKTGRPCGFEALVRWRHPAAGLMQPDQFIKLAEETGLIELLGEWIIERACADAALWPENIRVAVNLSPAQFGKGKLFDVILCALAESGLPPERLELEITESLPLQDAERHRVVIQQLKNIGVSIVLDDFGTGYSSLSYLTAFPFDKIKIDKSFTQGLSTRADCTAVVASVLTLARGLDIAVTAEGVETKQQFELLRAAGFNEVQGYLLGRPSPISELNLSAAEPIGQADQVA